MTVLTQLWKEQTADFSLVQKAIIGVILSVILTIALAALVLVYLELTK